MFDDFYGLEARPFQLTPDPAFYFESVTHRKALSYLGYGLAQGEGFVAITGEVGSGKSTLVAYLMATIDPGRMTAANVVTSALDGEEIVHVVARAFGVEVDGHDKASALGAIEAFLHEEARAGRRSLLIVDEAQNLSITALEELRMLSNFQLGSHPLLQTLLLGQPEFRTTLMESDRLEQLRQRVIATHHLTAMQPKEVQAYIEHRLTCVGWDGNPSFDQRVFSGIYEATGGVPRRINQVANRLLLLGSVEQRTRIDSAMLTQVLDEMKHDGTIGHGHEGEDARTAHHHPDHSLDNGVPASVAIAHDAAFASEEEGRSAARAGHAAIDAPAAIALIESALADRDAQICELQQAVVELANKAEAHEAQALEAEDPSVELVGHLEAQLAEAHERTAALEARLDEQERTLRHVLTMLIEWVEGGGDQRSAA
ncbi:XrtA/PEP-CTERM system-associated ATPase [Novosphingobium mangrovi (ex Hu et al. 2023)]|uniref:XrtA-associated ATPase n=1 Tax=Novosphingobium mangrovi (ex Hu et al. 2023) TaxID=2930094 RepID=A0ABT0A938_9SPHN|nr:XrtA/PEP-CTERM system-associated ATPase [Novosphingobium mangrovi (ex Hu et al. 2023)]MCJ1959710.1 XrtA-associated ATPase [Novosphingobium mangrovi (ex Hu et al. 2023)]